MTVTVLWILLIVGTVLFGSLYLTSRFLLLRLLQLLVWVCLGIRALLFILLMLCCRRGCVLSSRSLQSVALVSLVFLSELGFEMAAASDVFWRL